MTLTISKTSERIYPPIAPKERLDGINKVITEVKRHFIPIGDLVKMPASLNYGDYNLPVYPTTEIKQIKVDDGKKFEVIEKVKEGVKIIDENEWVLIRASNTSPIIRVNAEGKTTEKAQALLELGEKFVREK